MTTFHKILSLSVAVFLGALPVHGQDFHERLKADYNIAAGIYHPYHHGDLTDTKAPAGYKPFYISHFGRHGSRYHASMDYFATGTNGLIAAKEAGILTETGLELYDGFMRVVEEHKGMEGELAPLGALEHKEIAARMYRRFPSVFNSRSRNEVECVASTITRCIMSMANFSESLDDMNPDLDFTFLTGEKYFSYIMKPSVDKTISRKVRVREDSVRKADCGYDKLFDKLFTDKQKAKELIKKRQDFVNSVYMVGSICLDLDYLNLDILKYIDMEELTPQVYVRSDRLYGECCNSAEYGDVSNCSADDLLADFLSKADAALEDGSRRAADLRFGHDTGLMPLMGLMGVKELAVQYNMVGAHEHWFTYDVVPMGSNFQMIFYRNKKGNVLVKMLYNEQETCIPALAPAEGPYYSWPELREYLNSKEEAARAFNTGFKAGKN